MAATRLLMAALVVLGACPSGAWAACTDDFEVDLCDSGIMWEGCVDDPDVDLCDPDIKWEACVDDPEADLCDGDGVTTSPEPGADVRVSGTISFSLALSNKTLVQEGARISIAAHFDVAASIVSVNATESRRLSAGFRRLPGLWSVTYEFLAPAAKVQAIKVKMEAIASSPDDFKAAFATEFKAYLTASGVSADVVNALVVSDATAVDHSATTTTTIESDLANGAVRSQTGSGVVFLLAALLGGGAKSVLLFLPLALGH